MHLIPQSWSHLHILVSVFPSCGLMFVLGFYIAGFITNNDGMKRASLALFGLLALLAVPTYISGVRSMAVLADASTVSKGDLNIHYYLGLVALAGLVIAGAAAWYELWRPWGRKQQSRQTMSVGVGPAILTPGRVVVVSADGWAGTRYDETPQPRE